MNTSANEGVKNRQNRRLIWILIAGIGLAIFIFLAILYSGRQSETPTVGTAETTPVRAESIGVRPPIFRQITEFSENNIPRLRILGEAEPGAVIIISNRGERMRQVRTNEQGQWALTLGISADPMVLEAQLYTSETGPSIRSEEAIFRVPVPEEENIATSNFITSALIMVTAPGRPTRIVQSPFGGAPTSGPLTLSAIDYDDTGGVIITGVSSRQGRVRLYAQDNVVGETGVDIGGRWSYIAGRMLPRGEWEIRAELIPAGERENTENERPSVSVPFALLPPLRAQDGENATTSVNYQPLYWQVRRTLVGGGGQSTVVFSPDVVE